MSIKYDIVIPAFNAQKTLPSILNSIRHLTVKPDTVFVVDDGSTDETSKIASEYDYVNVIRLKANQGKGGALRAGIREFLQKNKSDYLLLMDADGQHPVSCIPDFLEQANQDHADIWIGYRSKKIGRMPALRIFSNTVSSLITSWVTGQKISDSQCGFRLLKRAVIERIELSEDGFQIETELIVKAARQGFNMQFVPIPTIYNGEKSYINHFGDTIRFITIILRELISR